MYDSLICTVKIFYNNVIDLRFIIECIIYSNKFITRIFSYLKNCNKGCFKLLECKGLSGFEGI